MSVLKEKHDPQLNKMTHAIEKNEREGPALKKQKVAKGETGRVCHQCHQPRAASQFLECTRKNSKAKKNRGICSKPFCDSCLLRVYDIKRDNIATISAEDAKLHDPKGARWSCPVCEGTCVCSKCRQEKGLTPVGNVKSFAESKGLKPSDIFKSESLIKEALEHAANTPNRRKSTSAAGLIMVDPNSPKRAAHPAMNTLQPKEFSFFTNPMLQTLKGRGFKHYVPPKAPGDKTVFQDGERSNMLVLPDPNANGKAKAGPSGTANGAGKKSQGDAKSMMGVFTTTPRQRNIEVVMPKNMQKNQATLANFFIPAPAPTTLAQAGNLLNNAAALQNLHRAVANLLPPAPPPVPARVEPPTYEKLEVDIDDDLLELRLDIRAHYFKFKRTVKTMQKHATELSNANGNWTALIYKRLAFLYLAQMQADEKAKLWDTEELYTFIKAHEKTDATSEGLWFLIHEFFPDLQKQEFKYEEGEEERTWAKVVRFLQMMFCQTAAARKQLADDVELAKTKHKEYVSLRNKLTEENKTLEGEAQQKYKCKIGLLEFEDWYVQRQLSSRLKTCLGKDKLGNEYHFFNQDSWEDDNWGHWVIVKKAPGLPHPSGVAQEDIPEDFNWFCLYTSSQLYHLHDYLLYQAWEVRANTERNQEFKELAREATKLASFYKSEEEAARLHVEIPVELTKNI